MKIRYSLLTLAGLALSFALPAFAREPSTPDSQVRQQYVALAKKLDEAWNNNDATALTALYAEDAVIITDRGPIYGREAIAKYFADLLQNVHFSNHLVAVDQYSPHIIGTTGNEIWWNGQWTTTLQVQTGGPIQSKGFWSMISIREGDAWKCRMETWNLTPAPTQPAETK